ncbi:MAG: hypothetical protein PHS42_11885 [Sulfurimonas sp.]|nr:hypothetical protein [Sulfurimonas sp.]
MKTLLMFFLTLSLLQSDELKRIESIINDIAKLRVEHEECQRALELKGILKVETTKEYDSKNYEQTIEILKAKNSDLNKKIEEKIKIVKNSKNEIEIYKKEVKTKEDKIKTLKKQLALLEKNKKNKPKIVVKEVIKEVVKEKKIYPKDDNVFPTLMPKNVNKIKEAIEDKEKIEVTKPTTYRLKSDSKIYNKFDGDETYLWEKDRSFTSNIRTQNFIKITGFFVNLEWQSAEEELWIKKVDVFER